MIFSKGDQTIVSFWRFCQETKQNFSLILCFQVVIRFHPSELCQMDAVIVSLKFQRTVRVIINYTEPVFWGFFRLQYLFQRFIAILKIGDSAPLTLAIRFSI